MAVIALDTPVTFICTTEDIPHWSWPCSTPLLQGQHLSALQRDIVFAEGSLFDQDMCVLINLTITGKRKNVDLKPSLHRVMLKVSVIKVTIFGVVRTRNLNL